jgi:hypothetical protein|tara:strand:- start:120 stop:512 length:393 start_codon:yes stop_codon:yes gene_type:complete
MHYFHDVLTQEEANGLTGYLNFSDNIPARLVDLCSTVADVRVVDGAYVRVEEKKEGHPWHFDTGTKGHMPWCKWSVSCLLSPVDSFEGGGFYFRDSEPYYHHLDMLLFSGLEHKVARSSGNRRVLLMFMG